MGEHLFEKHNCVLGVNIWG